MPSSKEIRKQRHQAQVKTQPGKAIRGAQSTEFVKDSGYRKTEFIGGKKYYTPMSVDPTTSGAGEGGTSITLEGASFGAGGDVRSDGTVHFTQPQTGVDPTSDGHLTTKSYVDGERLPNTITSPANNQLLKYNSSSSEWVNFSHDFLSSYAVNDSYTGSSLSPAVFGLKQTGATNVTTLRGVRSANSNMTITLEENLSDGAYLKFNVASPTGIQSVQGYDQLNDSYASAISGNTNLKFNDAYNTGNSTGIFFTVTDSGNDTIVTPTIAFPPNTDTNTTYTTSWVDSGDNAILRLTAGGSGSGNNDLTIVKGSNITLTPSGDNLTITANNTTNYSLVNSTGNPSGSSTLVMSNSGTEGRIRALKGGTNISLSTTDSDSDTGYVTINATLSGATITTQEANPLGGWLSQTTGTLRFIDNGRITWSIGNAGSNITTVTPTVSNPSYSDVGAAASNHNHNSVYSPIAGSTSITTVGTIGTGTWQGSSISTSYTDADNYGSWTVSSDSGSGNVGSGNTMTIAGSAPISTSESSLTVTVSLDQNSINDTYLTYNTGQHLTTSSSPDFANVKTSSSGHFKAVATSANTARSGMTVYNNAESGYLSYSITTGDHSSGWGWEFSNQHANSTNPTYSLRLDYSGSTLRCKGDVIAYQSSDPRLKKNKELISNPLDKISQLGGYSFDWKDEAIIHGYHLKGHDYGVMADEVEKIFPEIVDIRINEGKPMKAVDYKKLIPLLIESIKELKGIINEQLQSTKDCCESCNCVKR